MLLLLASGALLGGYVAIAVNPYVPINPYPPPLPSSTPTRTTAEIAPSPSPSLPHPRATSISHFLTPTPIHPTTPTPTPTPTMPFTATVERRASETCRRLELAGTVTDQEGAPLEGYPVHVWGPGVNRIVLSGSDPTYGPSGWSVTLVALEKGNISVRGTWYAQLHRYDAYRGHPPLSTVVRIEMTGTCSESIAVIHFQEAQEGGNR